MFKYNRSWLLKRLIGSVATANGCCSELIFLCTLAVDRRRAGSSAHQVDITEQNVLNRRKFLCPKS